MKIFDYLLNIEFLCSGKQFITSELNNNKKLGSLEMGVLYDKLPENIKNQIMQKFLYMHLNHYHFHIFSNIHAQTV